MASTIDEAAQASGIQIVNLRDAPNIRDLPWHAPHVAYECLGAAQLTRDHLVMPGRAA